MTNEKAIRVLSCANKVIGGLILVVFSPVLLLLLLHRWWSCRVLGVPRSAYSSSLLDFAMPAADRDAANFAGDRDGLSYATRPVPRFAPTSNDRGPVTSRFWIASQRD